MSDRQEDALTISVIVPAHNAERTLEQCLRSILSSVYPPREIIVVDDASSDRTVQIAEEYSVTIIKLDVNRGEGYARNVGSRTAQGDILAFVDSDVILAKDSLQILAEYFRKHPHVSAVTGRLSREHPNQNFASQFKNLYMNAVFARMPIEVDFVYGSVFSVRRKSFMPMSEERILGEDTEFGHRLTASGRKIHLLRQLEVVHLKRHTLGTLFTNDFWIPFYFARTLVKQSRYRTLAKEQRFSHASRRQTVSIVMTVLMVASLLSGLLHWSGWLAGLGLAVVAAILNADLLTVFRSERGLRFAVAAVGFMYLDMLVMAAGVFWGLVSTVTGDWGVRNDLSN
jgi:glycosyltransferase involved in cell wall biosynthesis